VEYEEKNPSGSLALCSRSLDAIGRQTTLVTARIHARMARAHAALGDRPAAFTSLTRAEAALGSGEARCWPFAPETPRGFVFAPDLLATTMGETHALLGDMAGAKAACEQAASLLAGALGPDAAKISSAVSQNQCTLAIALAGRGEVEEACHVATRALDVYEGVGKAAVLREARRFERALAARPPTPHAREFTELLRDRERRLDETV
jgi:hypothetical protein